MSIRSLPLLLMVCCCLVPANLGCHRSQPAGGNAPPTPVSQASGDDHADIEPAIYKFCGNCHAPPVAGHFPRDAWHDEVERGFEFYYLSGRTDLKIPSKSAVVSYYRQLAPDKLVLEDPPERDTKLQFTQEAVPLASGGESEAAAIAFIKAFAPQATTGTDSDRPSLLVCDMRGGQVARIEFTNGGTAVSTLAQLDNPAHIEPCDLDQDGEPDFVVGDLGSFLPEDHERGRVVWLRRSDDSADWQAHPLAEGLGRVVDVQPGDLDADGDVDLVVAEFGWLETGRLLLLINTGETDQGVPRFETRVQDPRHGSIHVPVADFNNDGRLDFAALFAQEYETVELFVNQGDLVFATELAFAAPDPAYGSSGIELCDLDGDGDLDLLYANGDTLDSYYLKPYHAIHWLENQGEAGWTSHELAKMPGAMRAIAADLDSDGDLDVVASAMLAKTLAAQVEDLDRMASLIWIEQVEPGRFVPRTLEQGNLQHAAVAAADLDGDGDTDLAVGNFSRPDSPAVTLWWNQARP